MAAHAPTGVIDRSLGNEAQAPSMRDWLQTGLAWSVGAKGSLGLVGDGLVRGGAGLVV
jgi:hypothetical protein